MERAGERHHGRVRRRRRRLRQARSGPTWSGCRRSTRCRGGSSPAGAASPADGRRRVRRSRRQGARHGRGVAGRGEGLRQLLGDGRVDRCRWRRRARRAVARRCVRQRRAHRPRDRRSERAPLWLRGQGLPRGGGQRHGDRPDHRPAGQRTELRHDGPHRPDGRHRPVASVCNLSISTWRSSVARWPSASGRRSSTPRSRRSTTTAS